MLSYRHAFHAGNHADVLKHVVTIQLLRYMNQKDTPYMYIDTHAGAGVYALDDGYAAKTPNMKPASVSCGNAKICPRRSQSTYN